MNELTKDLAECIIAEALTNAVSRSQLRSELDRTASCRGTADS